jgi:hypothetical protein
MRTEDLIHNEWTATLYAQQRMEKVRNEIEAVRAAQQFPSTRRWSFKMQFPAWRLRIRINLQGLKRTHSKKTAYSNQP